MFALTATVAVVACRLAALSYGNNVPSSTAGLAQWAQQLATNTADIDWQSSGSEAEI